MYSRTGEGFRYYFQFSTMRKGTWKNNLSKLLIKLGSIKPPCLYFHALLLRDILFLLNAPQGKIRKSSFQDTFSKEKLQKNKLGSFIRQCALIMAPLSLISTSVKNIIGWERHFPPRHFLPGHHCHCLATLIQIAELIFFRFQSGFRFFYLECLCFTNHNVFGFFYFECRCFTNHNVLPRSVCSHFSSKHLPV